MDLDKTYTKHLDAVRNGIIEWLPPVDTQPREIHEAMHYSISAGGKRLRPVLVLAASELYPKIADPIPASVAIECIHTYSLIHDDLPCMDNSPLRRGNPSTHVKFGEALALLAGDALLTEAFVILGNAYKDNPVVAAQLLKTLSNAAGSKHLIGGQVIDTLSEGEAIDQETLNFIHLNKTSALLTASLTLGLETTDHPESAKSVLTDMGNSLGLAFQIVDDILDATSDEATLGKTTGADVGNNKNTYVSLFGIEASRKAVTEQTKNAITQCDQLPGSPDTTFLKELIHSLEHRIQ